MKADGFGWALFPAIFLFSACAERELDFRREEGQVLVTPDWSGYVCPVSAGYGFYVQDGTGEPAVPVVTAVAAERYSATLPVQDYRMLAFNTDAPGVEYAGLECLETAEVKLSSTRQPGEVFTWNIDRVEITREDTVAYAPRPERLVKSVMLHFQVTGMEAAEVLQGELNGVYPSLSLLRGTPSSASVSAAPMTKTVFSATLTRTATRSGDPAYKATAGVRMFGLLCPEDGSAYDCRLHLKVSDTEGDVFQTTLDMNGVMTEVIRFHAGELPADEMVEVEIGIDRVNSTLVAEVKGWTHGSGSGEV